MTSLYIPSYPEAPIPDQQSAIMAPLRLFRSEYHIVRHNACKLFNSPMKLRRFFRNSLEKPTRFFEDLRNGSK